MCRASAITTLPSGGAVGAGVSRSCIALLPCPTCGTAASSCAGVLLLRVREEFVHRRLFHDVAAVHHDDAVGQVGHDPHVVRDEHDRGTELVATGAEQLEDLGLHGDVERCRGLVGDDELRVEDECHRDHDALLLPAGELVGVVVDPPLGIRDADFAQDLDRPRPRFRLRELLVGHKTFGDLEPDREDGIQGRRGLLENHRGIPSAHLLELIATRVDDVRLAAVPSADDDGSGQGRGLGRSPRRVFAVTTCSVASAR